MMQEQLDVQIDKIKMLKWYPWIGKDYNTSKLLVIGESHYEDGDGWQLGNKDAIRTIIQKRYHNEEGKWALYQNLEQILLDKQELSNDETQHVWNEIAYWNLVQKLLTSRKIVDRPSFDDYVKGWRTFFALEKILMPSHCLVLGKASFSSFGYYLNNIEKRWKKTNEDFASRKAFDLTDGDSKMRIVFINHPSTSFDFDYHLWASIVKAEFPSLY